MNKINLKNIFKNIKKEFILVLYEMWEALKSPFKKIYDLLVRLSNE